MANREEQTRENRLALRQQLIDEGIPPYPQDGHKTHTNQEALDLENNELAIVAGRITAMRGHGKIIFIDIEDESGILQIVLKEEKTDNFYRNSMLYIGDFARFRGVRFETNAGQPSLLASSFDLISKAIRRLPDEITNPETSYRMRSVDLAISPEKREVFRKRSKIIASVRQTLVDEGYMEVETPTLQPIYGGANARPFSTHINEWDMDMFLRISPELYLKKLIMGGFSKVFEITKNFRNEGADKTHNPEFTMMECYGAYLDYNDMMDLTEKIYLNACLAANGTSVINFQGIEIDFAKAWRRLPMKQAIAEYLKINVDELDDDQLKQAIIDNGQEYKGEWIRGLGIATLFEAVEPRLIQPIFITDMPRETTSLCKPHRNDDTLIERFEPYIAGYEVANAYTELNDPILQRKFWEEERADDPEAHPLDESYIKSMEFGLAPTGGLGIGMDRMTMFLTNQTKIRDVILFPTMKPLEKKEI